MARRKSKNDLREQRKRIIDALNNKIQSSFQSRYSSVVKSYKKNWKDPQARKAYEAAQKEFSNSNEYKRMVARANRVNSAEERYIKNIEKSKEYKALRNETKKAQAKFDNEPYSYGNASYKNELARKANVLEHRKNTDKFSRETYMGKASIAG